MGVLSRFEPDRGGAPGRFRPLEHARFDSYCAGPVAIARRPTGRAVLSSSNARPGASGGPGASFMGGAP